MPESVNARPAGQDGEASGGDGAVATRTRFTLQAPVDSARRFLDPNYLMLIWFGTTMADVRIGEEDSPQQSRVRTGALVFLEPNTLFDARLQEAVELLVVSVHPEHVRQLADAAVGASSWEARTVRELLDPGISALGQEIRRSVLSDQFSQDAYRQSLADAIVVRLLCHFLGETERQPARGEALSPGRLARIVRHIDEHLEGAVRVDELAALAGLTRSHFSRAFQRMTGDPPQRFIHKRRVCRARDLLSSSDLGVADVAVRTGFSSQAHLATAFRHEVGTTPGRYRSSFRRDAAE